MLRKHIGEGHASQQGFGNPNNADESSGKAAGSRSGKNSSKKSKGKKRDTKHRRSIEPVRFDRVVHHVYEYGISYTPWARQTAARGEIRLQHNGPSLRK